MGQCRGAAGESLNWLNSVGFSCLRYFRRITGCLLPSLLPRLSPAQLLLPVNLFTHACLGRAEALPSTQHISQSPPSKLSMVLFLWHLLLSQERILKGQAFSLSMASHTASQKYLSTQGDSYNILLPFTFIYNICIYMESMANHRQLSFEETIFRALAPDNGLFIPEEIPSLPPNWQHDWLLLSFEELAFQIFSLYISPTEIPPAAIRDVIYRSYLTFRMPDVAPTVTLDEDNRLHLLELFHGPTL